MTKVLKFDDYTFDVKKSNSYSFELHCNKEEPINGRQKWILKYDGNDKTLFLERDGKKVVPNEKNLDDFLPRTRTFTYWDYRSRTYNEMEKRDNINSLLKELLFKDIDEDKYKNTLKDIAMEGEERVFKLSRIIIRLLDNHGKVELLTKDEGLYSEHFPSLGSEIKSVSRKLKEGDKQPTKPHEVLGMESYQYNFMKFYSKLAHESDRVTYSSTNIIENIRSMNRASVDMYIGLIKYVQDLALEYPGVEFGIMNFMNSDTSSDISGIRNISAFSKIDNWEYNERMLNHSTGIFSFAKLYNYDIKRLVEYLYFELPSSQGITNSRYGYTTLRDYMNMASSMGIKLDKYPKSLKLTHDVTALNYRYVKNEIELSHFMDRVSAEDYTKLIYQDKDYSIIVPTEPKDLTMEGSNLNHCLSSYIKSVSEGRCKIYFMRKTDDIDKSLVTLQINEVDGKDNMVNKVVQARGNSNRSLTSEEREWLDKYKTNKGVL